VRTNVATVVGPWFVWQEMVSSASSVSATYYFLPLAKG